MAFACSNVRRLFATVVVVVAFGSVIVFGEGAPLITARKNGIRAAEPGWQCRSAIQNRQPVQELSQRPILIGICEKPEGDLREDVHIEISHADSASEADQFLSSLRDRKVPKEWKVTRFDIGDEAYLATYGDGRQFDISFRKDRTLVHVSSSSLPLAKRAAADVVSQLPLK